MGQRIGRIAQSSNEERRRASSMQPWLRTSQVPAKAVRITIPSVGQRPIRPPTWMKSAISMSGTARNRQKEPHGAGLSVGRGGLDRVEHLHMCGACRDTNPFPFREV
jgi:hypothetical protein